MSGGIMRTVFDVFFRFTLWCVSKTSGRITMVAGALILGIFASPLFILEVTAILATISVFLLLTVKGSDALGILGILAFCLAFAVLSWAGHGVRFALQEHRNESTK
jgi:hypothetical protein